MLTGLHPVAIPAAASVRGRELLMVSAEAEELTATGDAAFQHVSQFGPGGDSQLGEDPVQV
jgi:hypothetical protein